LLAFEAEAATVNLLGRSIEAAIPTGYCEVGGHLAEAEIVSRIREGIGNSNQILAMFADCKELEDFRNGRRTMLDNYGQILAQTPKGQLRALKGLSRSEYIRKISGKTNDFTEAFKKAETRVKQIVPGLQLGENLGILSTDSNGIYVGLLMTMPDDTGRARSIIGIVGMTLVREMSITINLYQPFKNSTDLRGLLARQQSAIASLVRVNH
jgi:hypothetical protein